MLNYSEDAANKSEKMLFRFSASEDITGVIEGVESVSM